MAKKTYHIKLKGYVGGWNFDANYVDYMLDKHKDEEVHVLINSLGGSVASAMSVSAAFARHGNVHVHYESMNASAATIASLGAKRVTIDRDAMYLVHKCSQVVFLWDQMNADQLQQLIEQCEKTKRDLDKIDLNIASGYARRCKKEKAELLDLMKEGGWLTAEEALAWGFVDEVTADPEDEKPRMTEDVKNYLAAEGIPMPNVPMEEDDERGLLSRLKEFLRGLYTTNEPTNQILSKMKKTYVNVCRILKCEGLDASEDGKIVMTEEQVQTIEDAMATDGDKLAQLQADVAQRDKDIAGLQAQIAAKDAEIAALAKKPAADTKQVNNEGGDTTVTETNELKDFCDDMAEAQKTLDQLKK